jgi:hypothetical protein
MHNAAVDWEGLYPLLARVLAVVCAAGAGWALGRGVPDWRADVRQETRDYTDQYGSDGAGCEALGCIMLGEGLRGNVWGILFIIGAIVLGCLGWSDELLGEETLFLFEPACWLLMGAAVVGYVAAVATDKGPVGPLE